MVGWGDRPLLPAQFWPPFYVLCLVLSLTMFILSLPQTGGTLREGKLSGDSIRFLCFLTRALGAGPFGVIPLLPAMSLGAEFGSLWRTPLLPSLSPVPHSGCPSTPGSRMRSPRRRTRCLTWMVSSIVPKMAADYLTWNKSISPAGCGLQIFVSLTLGGAESFLLAAMSYDRYIAVCHPLRYPVLLNWQLCIQMTLGSWFLGAADGLMQAATTLSFPFCSAHEIDHFFCEAPTPTVLIR